MIEFGRAFNALAEPIAKSVLSVSMAPYRLARSLIEYSIARGSRTRCRCSAARR